LKQQQDDADDNIKIIMMTKTKTKNIKNNNKQTEDILTSRMSNMQLVPQSALKYQVERAREDAYSKLA
jgi:hypothetical protein